MVGFAVEVARTYRGVRPAARREERRERLLEAGLELFGTIGYAHSSVREVCAAASLNSRYFYESFQNREDLLVAIYQRVGGEIFARASEAAGGQDTVEAQARATIRAAWAVVSEDRRKGRIIAIEVVGVSERVERMRHETRQALAQLTSDNAMTLVGPNLRLRLDPILVARFLIGGVVEVLLEWINGDLNVSSDQVVDHFTTLFTAAAAASVVRDDATPRRSSAHRAPRARSRTGDHSPAPGGSSRRRRR
jgi:AcrR family transcriptional regulator